MTKEGVRPAIAVDREVCMGSGVCVALAPATFAHDAETKAIVLDADGDSVASLEAAVEGCPTGAITLSNHAGD